MQIGQQVGPFVIDKELGSGAMGSVYRARFIQDGKDERIVALKVIAFGLSNNDQALARFEREANILKQLKHPNIVRLHATGRYKNTPFFAMEYVAGQSLDKIIAERLMSAPTRPPFTWEEVVEMGKPLCSALQHAHDKGIVHRDLKPSNLMMTEEGILKLTDFGIAKDLDVTALTGQNNTIGTAAYMSPEQCKGERFLTGKSDIYSLGIVFYELLTGRKPFVAESSVDMFLLHVNGSFIRPAQINPTIPIWLDTLVCQMMEKKPELRPRDAAMVGLVLDEITEKVTAQRSAGADVAGARAIDRVHLTGIPDQDDRNAAKAIRAGGKKKKLRKKKRPIYTRGWFVSIAAILFVVGFGTLLWFAAFAPPSAARLLEKIESANTPEAKASAIAEYLKHYADRNDEKTELVKSLDRDLKVRERERVLLNRHGRSNLRSRGEEGDDPEAYRKTMAALTAENDGDLAQARTFWSELEKLSSESDAAKALWGWHAKRKLADLTETANKSNAITKKIAEEFRLEDKDIKFENDIEQRANIALRLEEWGDFALARERWSQLAETLSGNHEQRAWFVFAKHRWHLLEAKKAVPKDAAERAKKLGDRLAFARPWLTTMMAETPAQRRDARNILRDIRDLYSGETGDIGRIVAEAEKLLKDHPN